MDLLVKNVLLPGGRVADIAIDRGHIRHIGSGSGYRFEDTIDGNQALCLPGAIDMHVHMRGGSQAYKEDWQSGSMSAVAGGVTMVVDQPNVVPPLTTPLLLLQRMKEASATSYCNFALNGGVLPGADISGMWQAGAMAFGETFAAASSYGEALSTDELKAAFQKIHALGALITIHAETVLEGDDSSLVEHDLLRSPDGEARAVSMVCGGAPPGLRIHFCHLSTARAIGLHCGTCEVTPHHLFLSLEDFEPEDGCGKVNPPLRVKSERKKLWEQWNAIDIIASDHAPHCVEEKSGEFQDAPSGIPGVETMMPLLLAQVLHRRVSLESVLAKTVERPAEILGIQAPGLYPGERADLALYPKKITSIRSDMLHSKSGWTPFEGMDALFPDIVIVNGRCVLKKGEFLMAAGVWYPGNGYLLP
jgi:dihydroorotase